MGFLTGEPASKTSSSSNQAYGLLSSTYAPQMQTGVAANNALAGLLGVGGDPNASNAAFQNFLNSSGYQNVLKQAGQGITGSAAARGLLQSGATAKALQSNAANLGSNYFSQYLQQLGGLSGQGLQAGGLVGGAGQTSTGQQTGGSGGLLGAVGSIGSLFSDRRLKRGIKLIGRFPNGLGLYVYRYVWGFSRHLGVMADEVETLFPQALGPTVFGFKTVNYDMLRPIMTQANGGVNGLS